MRREWILATHDRSLSYTRALRELRAFEEDIEDSESTAFPARPELLDLLRAAV